MSFLICCTENKFQIFDVSKIIKNLARFSECERKLQEAEDVFKMKLQDKIDGMQKLLERESQRCQVLFNLDLFENFHCF